MKVRPKPISRRERIVDHLREHERATVEQLADWLGSSRETIRRDLTALAESGSIRKFHGGAVLTEVRREEHFSERLVEAVREKKAIASAAAGLFGEGSTLFIDVGTTTLLFAKALVTRPDLTVITNGIEIAATVGSAGLKVFVIGGELRSEMGEAVGGLAVEQIERFHASDAVITVAALSPTGAMDFQLDEAQVARAMVRQARSLTVLADASKLGRNALFQVCPLEDIDRLVVDRTPDAELARALKAAAVEVIVANPVVPGD